MNIGFAIDINYSELLINTINSILQHHKENIIFYIIVDCRKTILHLQLLIKQFLVGCDIKLKMMESDDIDFFQKYTRINSELRQDIKVIHYGQILFEKYFKINKILYLEADQIIQNNLSKMYHTNINNYGLAAVPIKNDQFTKIVINDKLINHPECTYKEENCFYFNAGVTLINFDFWKKNQIFNTFKKLIIENYKSKTPLYIFYTQGILNILFYNNYKFLNEAYNMVLSDFYLDPDISKVSKATILHYNGQRIKNHRLIDEDIRQLCFNIYKKYDILKVMEYTGNYE